MVNSSWKRFFDQPIFWLKKLDTNTQDEEKFSPETVHQCWKKLVKELEDANISTEFALILIKIYKSEYHFQSISPIQFHKTRTYSLENHAIHACKIPDFKKFAFDHNASAYDQYVYVDGYGTTKVYGNIQMFFMFGFIDLWFYQLPALSIDVSVCMEKDYPILFRVVKEQQQQKMIQ